MVVDDVLGFSRGLEASRTPRPDSPNEPHVGDPAALSS
jgi:hypothetical protein